jgi:8-oxo-dGTP pyrophosphatase MutT (NUDIX family)
MADSLEARLRTLPFTGAGGWQGVPAAVLLAFAPVDGDDDLDIILVRRPDSMRNHAGQVSFPGGAVDASDADATAAALREAEKEVGLDPGSVEVLGALPRVPISVSGFDVQPVVGLWPGKAELRPNPAECDVVFRPRLRELADPANHGLVPLADLVSGERLRAGQFPPDATTPVFRVAGQIVWGFTAGVLITLMERLELATPPLPPGWPRPGPAPPP